MVRNPAGNSPTSRSGADSTGRSSPSKLSATVDHLVAGRLASPNLPDQLALLRSGVGTDLDSLIMFNVNSGGFSDVFPGQNGQWKYSPNFTSLALADLAAPSRM